MSIELRDLIFQALDDLVLIDPHTHINPLSPSSRDLSEILGYHYYTELAHSAGMPKSEIEEPGISGEEKVRRLFQYMPTISNTIQFSWFQEILTELFELPSGEFEPTDFETIWSKSTEKLSAENWLDEVMQKSKLEALFLTNDFDDPLEGFDTKKFIPCLRTDDLVFHLQKQTVRERLAKATGVDVTDANSLVAAIEALFQHFIRNNVRACAISLPPSFEPRAVSRARADVAISALYKSGENCDAQNRTAVGQFVFWTLAEKCREHRLPFDLMIGVNRRVYAEGVYQGQDLYDSRVSLIQYQELFNAFLDVKFPISVLASVTNQELTSYAWIFPNVITHGHWWYSNTPTFIEHDLAARLEAVPRTKQIGYYSDMYKMEFALPKFRMFKRILAKVLAEKFVIDRGWTEQKAIDLGKQVLRGNVETTFGPF